MKKALIPVALASPLALCAGDGAKAQVPPLVDICTGLTVSLPVLQPLAGLASGIVGGLLEPVLNGLIGDINLNLRDALSGRNLGVSALDGNGNLITAPGGCALTTSGLTVDAAGGIAVGGGRISGLGPTTSAAATAGHVDAMAIGHGATTGASPAALALGLRAAVDGARGIALGADAAVNVAGGVALGAGASVARTGLAGAAEAFSGQAVSSTQGAVSIGTVGGERQIVNVAGGTQATDAVNVRQLRSVADSTAAALGGGASVGPGGSWTGPSFTLRSGIYGDVGSALTALDNAIAALPPPVVPPVGPPGPPSSASGVIDGENAGGRPAAAATGTDSLAAGYGARAASEGGVALGAGALAERAGLAGGREAFSGATVASTRGAVSIGATGEERQIVNLAGGTQDTDAVNLRQLRSATAAVAGSIGGGAGFDAEGRFTGPTYVLRGGIHRDVGSALAALDQSTSVIAGNDTSAAGPAIASGADTVAAGHGAVAEGARATALGHRARASAAGSTAIGVGAAATRTGQVAIGTAATTYTLPGLGSAASRAAQSGPTQVVTTDASGNLAAIPIDIAALDRRIDAVGSGVAALGTRVGNVERELRDTRREARQGVAAAMAMTAAPMPSRPGRTSWAGNTATFRGEWAAGFSMAHRFDLPVPVAINAGVSLAGNGFGGARLGLSGEF